MNPLSTVTGILTLPARTAGAVAVAGVRTTSRVIVWAVEQAAGSPTPARRPQVPSHVAPVTPPDAPMEAASAKKATATKAPAKKKKKVPASQVPLKSAPTPSLPAALESFDTLDDIPEPASASAPGKTAPKKTAPKKTSAKRAPSKKAAVVAPALGLSESEVTENPSGTDQG